MGALMFLIYLLIMVAVVVFLIRVLQFSVGITSGLGLVIFVIIMVLLL